MRSAICQLQLRRLCATRMLVLSCGMVQRMENHDSTSPAGAAFDARLARVEEECAAERERYMQEATAHSHVKERASQLQVSSRATLSEHKRSGT